MALLLPVFKVLLLYITLAILHCTAMCSINSMQQRQLQSLWPEPGIFLVLPDGIILTPDAEMNLQLVFNTLKEKAFNLHFEICLSVFSVQIVLLTAHFILILTSLMVWWSFSTWRNGIFLLCWHFTSHWVQNKGGFAVLLEC